MSDKKTVEVLEFDAVNNRYLVAHRPEPDSGEIRSTVAWVRSYATAGQPKVGQTVEVRSESLEPLGEIRTSIAQFQDANA